MPLKITVHESHNGDDSVLNDNRYGIVERVGNGMFVYHPKFNDGFDDCSYYFTNENGVITPAGFHWGMGLVRLFIEKGSPWYTDWPDDDMHTAQYASKVMSRLKKCIATV